MDASKFSISTFHEFFEWCAAQNLYRALDIARAFGRTPQTIENWRKGRSRQSGALPLHIGLSCIGYEALRRETGLLVLSDTPLTFTMFDVWRSYYGLGTLDKTAAVFGLTRQAVHKWYVRNQLPRWLNLACHGYAHQQNAMHPRTNIPLDGD